jgi:hypothetical protein
MIIIGTRIAHYLLIIKPDFEKLLGIASYFIGA